MTFCILADENIPAVEHYFGADAAVRRVGGRKLQRSHLQGVDVLLVRSVTQINEALLHGTSIKFVGTATSGVDHIDQDYLRQQGIGFAHAPGSNANSVVEYVLAAIAAVTDKLERLLAGGSVGIIGYGVIGKAMAARLRALGIHYQVYDPWLDEKTISNPAGLARVLSCDVVTLHCELTRKQPWPSFHLLGEEQLACLSSDSLLINASRGSVVDNRAMLALLETRWGPATVFDVWEGEPQIPHVLLEQVTLGTAHIAGYSLDGKLLATRMLSDAAALHLGLALPERGGPAGEPAALTVPGALAGAPLMRHLLEARYDIRRDDALLRSATLGQDIARAGLDFDFLRKQYRERRELLGSTVLANFQSQQDLEMVRGLGCVPVSSESGS
jgi:erythronate-4-phosphate dehydrogenase